MSFAAIAIGGATVGIAGGVGKMIGRGKANKQMRALMAENPVYKENPLARQRMGLAQTLLNARMPGAAQAEQNIFSNQANQISNIGRGASSAAQFLALGAQAQGQTNQNIADLAMGELDYKKWAAGNLAGAQEGVIAEGDKVFQDQTRRFQDKAQIQGAINANRQANWGDVSGMGFGVMNAGLTGMSGGFGKLFNGDTQVNQTPMSFSQLQGNRPIDYNLINTTYRKFQ